MAPTGRAIEQGDLKDGDIVIALVGPTGAGKGNMIDKLTSGSLQKGRRGLQACTQTFAAVRVQGHAVYGNRIVLVDTPGFNNANTSPSDSDILDLLGNWIKSAPLFGILYLHSITERRMTLLPEYYIGRLGRLAPGPVGKVALVTTMWDRVPPSSDRKNERRDEIMANYWKAMSEKGSKHYPFDNTEYTAWKIVEEVIQVGGSTDLKTGLPVMNKNKKGESPGFFGKIFRFK